MIEVERLNKRYGNRQALKDVSFKAHEGEILGLLGANGAGKTTTMRIVTGFMPPTSGIVRVNGTDMREASLTARQQVGYLPEKMPIYPEMTVRDFVLFWARLRRVKHAQARTEAVLKQFDLAHRKHQLVSKLSKGLRQRLGLAQALVHEPRVIVLDEPTIGIDPMQVIEVRDIIKGLKGAHTVLFSSHILSEVEQICERVVILHEGIVVAEGAPQTLSQTLRGKQHFFLDADKTPLERVQSALKGFAEVQAHAKGFTLIIAQTNDPRAELSRRLSQANIPILELRPQETRLEDVFLKLIKD
jgi:ABC-2 type transport system ATP-binding protein